MRQITLRIIPKSVEMLRCAYRGEIAYRYRDNVIGLVFPKKKYRVRFSLREDGEFMAGLGYLYRPGREDSYTVCFLPSNWLGKRVKRTVLAW